MQKDPSSFLHNHGSFYDLAQHSRPQPTPPQQPVGRVVPAPVAIPLLTVSYAKDKEGKEHFRCTLSRALLAAIPHLKNGNRSTRGSYVMVIVPPRRGGSWFLDTRPKPGSGTQLPTAPDARAIFRLPPLNKTHFQHTKPQFETEQPGARMAGAENTLVQQLRFRLGPEVAGHQGYYQLLPA